jgi:hypothetical protein
MFGLRKGYSKSMLFTPIRCFGGGHHHEHEKRVFYSKSRQVKYKVPFKEEDLEEEFGGNDTYYNKMIVKLVGYLRPHRKTDLDNIRESKFSAYYWFPRILMFRNRAFLKFAAHCLETNKHRQSNAYVDPVQVHENSIFLYKSRTASTLLQFRAYDYYALTFLIYGTFISAYPLLWLPALIWLAEAPFMHQRLNYSTIRADLLPHTEQIVFTKFGLFGGIKREIVDIKNLGKITPDEVPNSYSVFSRVNFDKDFIWKDSESGRIYIFDKRGIWNEDGINHPLIN